VKDAFRGLAPGAWDVADHHHAQAAAADRFFDGDVFEGHASSIFASRAPIKRAKANSVTRYPEQLLSRA
jgi:hypothetical protein